jgi:flagellar basal-body rod modification protein FlgD
MSVLDSVRDLQNQTAWTQASAHASSVAESSNDRNVGGNMGKHDFLLLLSAQLRFQDPLNPQSDSDFAAGLAQFSSLEQMQNMNNTLESMATYQSYSLVGKFVVAEALVGGQLAEIPGVVDSVFMSRGVAMAQVGEFVVPVSSIKEVFDTNNILTPEMLMQSSTNLIGRTVIAVVGEDEEVEGIVTRILVDKGVLLAQIDDGTDEPKFVPVNTIVDIRETGTDKYVPKEPKPEVPPDAKNWKEDGEGGFFELTEDGLTEIGRWTWNEEEWKWEYECFFGDNEADEEPAAA